MIALVLLGCNGSDKAPYADCRYYLPPEETCSWEENYHHFVCGTCDRVWYCAVYEMGSNPRWSRSDWACDCVEAGGTIDTDGRCPRDY